MLYDFRRTIWNHLRQVWNHLSCVLSFECGYFQNSCNGNADCLPSVRVKRSACSSSLSQLEGRPR